jgi:SAM-dependent methyltransferase
VLNAFERSAHFYDDLYEGKNYAAETDYVDRLIQQHIPGAQSLLDLGCGTGRHAIEFAKKGYTVFGVDRSAEMITKARAHREELVPHIGERLKYEQFDICGIRLGHRFDAVVALFHVISYQTSNDDLIAVFTSAKAHLRSGGFFIFDCWYGPGVLTHPPFSRIKRLRSGSHRVMRIAEPIMRVNWNTVDVNYQFINVDEESGAYSEFSEVHKMRYFFIPELRILLGQAGLDPLAFTEWLTDREPSGATWNLTVVARNLP